MPRYVSPGRTPSPSRSPSRSTSRGYTYTDGVYTPSDSNSRLPSPSRSRSRRPSRRRGRSTGRSTSRADSYYSRSPSRSYSPSRSRSRSRSRSNARTSGVRSRLSSVLDTSSSTGKEKAENVVKTSLVMLGAIGAASLAAHKFWPKGITYGDPDFWEAEKEQEKEKKEKGKGKQEVREKLREGKDAVEGRGGGGPSRRDDAWSRAATDGGRNASRERRERYLQERLQERRRERLPLPAAVAGEAGAGYWESRDKRQAGRRYNDDYDDYYRGPPPSQRRIEAPRPPPAAPNPPDRYAAESPSALPTVIVPVASSRRGGSDRSSDRGQDERGPYYVERGSSVVVPSSGEREYIIRREAPAGQRKRVREGEREDAYYR